MHISAFMREFSNITTNQMYQALSKDNVVQHCLFRKESYHYKKYKTLTYPKIWLCKEWEVLKGVSLPQLSNC